MAYFLLDEYTHQVYFLTMFDLSKVGMQSEQYYKMLESGQELRLEDLVFKF